MPVYNKMCTLFWSCCSFVTVLTGCYCFPAHGSDASYQRVPSLRLEGSNSHEKLNASLPSVNCGPWYDSNPLQDWYSTSVYVTVFKRFVSPAGIATVMGTAGYPAPTPACRWLIKEHRGRCRSQCPHYWEKTPAHCVTAVQAVWWRR